MAPPMTSAIGMVMPMVNVAHDDSARMLTTAKPMAAMAMMTVKKMAMAATTPATGPISARAICGQRMAVAAHAARRG